MFFFAHLLQMTRYKDITQIPVTFTHKKKVKDHHRSVSLKKVVYFEVAFCREILFQSFHEFMPLGSVSLRCSPLINHLSNIIYFIFFHCIGFFSSLFNFTHWLKNSTVISCSLVHAHTHTHTYEHTQTHMACM